MSSPVTASRCDRIMVGSGTDTYDPTCDRPTGHEGFCKSSAAVDQHRIEWPLDACVECGVTEDLRTPDIGVHPALCPTHVQLWYGHSDDEGVPE